MNDELPLLVMGISIAYSLIVFGVGGLKRFARTSFDILAFRVTLILCQSTNQHQHKPRAFIERMDILPLKMNINIPTSQHPNRFQCVYCISCKAVGRLCENHIYLATAAGRKQCFKSISSLYPRSTDQNILPQNPVRILLNMLLVVLFLHCQT